MEYFQAAVCLDRFSFFRQGVKIPVYVRIRALGASCVCAQALTLWHEILKAQEVRLTLQNKLG